MQFKMDIFSSSVPLLYIFLQEYLPLPPCTSDVTSHLRRSSVLCALRASCHAAVIIALRKLVPRVRRIIGNYWFEILNFDAELERTHN